jgi:hypothetical protein
MLKLLMQPPTLVGAEDLAADATLEAALLLERDPHDAAEEGVVGEQEEGGGGGGGGVGGVGTMFLLVLAPALGRGQAGTTLRNVGARYKFVNNTGNNKIDRTVPVPLKGTVSRKSW